MRLEWLRVSNFRALRSIKIPLSRFGCLVGENNSGKSSVLQALELFFSSRRLSPADYFDPGQQVRIEVTFADITLADLARLAEQHRRKVVNLVEDGRLVLTRIYDTTGKSQWYSRSLVPCNPRFAEDAIEGLLKRGRAGAEFRERVLGVFPELEGSIDNMNQAAVRAQIDELAAAVPIEDKRYDDQLLQTGIDKSIVPMLPSPLYIPAVKDLSDDLKTAENSHFGRVLSILLEAIEPKLSGASEVFRELDFKLNIQRHEDGAIVDERLDEVRLIEDTVQKYVREGFGGVAVRLEIPPPLLRTVLSSARIYADDGVEGLVDSKGDGLRRAIVFSILRAWVELKETLTVDDSGELSAGEGGAGVEPAGPHYLLLFEEPELFLHPRAQLILFDALRAFAKEHSVVVTTHSPLFLAPEATETFVKLSKGSRSSEETRPSTIAHHVDLTALCAKDQFQIICFENNNAAFFAEAVVLVEGDSDLLVLPHIAKTLDPAWDVGKVGVRFARITGKGNIRRYRQFFDRFDVRVAVIADLDLLVGGFEHVSPTDALRKARDQLLQKVDELLQGDERKATTAEARKAHQSGELRSLWRRVTSYREALKAGACTEEEHDAAVEEFFAWQRRTQRLEVLKESCDAELLDLKWALLDGLRGIDVFVLERGAIEEYYPEALPKADKPTRAREFCARVVTREAALACCGRQRIQVEGNSEFANEFELIIQRIFGGKTSDGVSGQSAAVALEPTGEMVFSSETGQGLLFEV